MKLETSRLLIRHLQPSDAETLARLWTHPEVTRYMGGPRDFHAIRQGFEEDARSSPPPVIDLWPVIEKATGQVVGHCGLIDKEVEGQQEVELVYVFQVPAWGKGYATEAASAVRDYAFATLKLKRIIALIDPDNSASARVAIKLGMSFEKETRRPSGKVLRVYAMHAHEEDATDLLSPTNSPGLGDYRAL
jgi:RimJ/RimL family protein N-acetyltransferase